jgi:hypothetical protein
MIFNKKREEKPLLRSESLPSGVEGQQKVYESNL